MGRSAYPLGDCERFAHGVAQRSLRGRDRRLLELPSALARMTLVVAPVAVPICVLFAGAYFPLLPAQVCTASGSSVSGVLIGETSDRTYIGEAGKSAGALDVLSIPSSQTIQTIIGGNAAASVCPAAAPAAG
jgi:hypothetical protein